MSMTISINIIIVIIFSFKGGSLRILKLLSTDENLLKSQLRHLGTLPLKAIQQFLF